jgi:hypothetical protein
VQIFVSALATKYNRDPQKNMFKRGFPMNDKPNWLDYDVEEMVAGDKAPHMF